MPRCGTQARFNRWGGRSGGIQATAWNIHTGREKKTNKQINTSRFNSSGSLTLLVIMQNTTPAATGFNPVICWIINKSFFCLFGYFNPILQPKLPPADRPTAPADKPGSWSEFTVLSAPLHRSAAMIHRCNCRTGGGTKKSDWGHRKMRALCRRRGV